MRKSNHAMTLPSSSAGPGLTAILGDALTAAMNGIMRWRARARERRQLLAMTDRELRDIAITRVDAWREANKPLWKE